MSNISIKRRSYNGCSGFGIETFINFLTGERPLKYGEKNKTLCFYISDRFLSEEEDNIKMFQLLQAFKKFYGIEIEKISKYDN